MQGKKMMQRRMPWFFLAAAFFITACSFTYDTVNEDDQDPDMIMETVEYVRIEGGNPLFQIRAAEVRRYEARHIMEMDVFFFDQFNSAPEDAEKIPDINVQGNAGKARVETDTSNFFMNGGVSFEVKSEDISLETEELSWQDKERLLTSPGKLTITRSDGTTLEGTGFSADVRKKTWEFESDVEGSIVDND